MEKLKVRSRWAREVFLSYCFYFFYLLILKQKNILFETHLAKWGKTIFSKRITDLISKALGFDFILKCQYTHAHSVGDKVELEIRVWLHSSAFLEAEGYCAVMERHRPYIQNLKQGEIKIQSENWQARPLRRIPWRAKGPGDLIEIFRAEQSILKAGSQGCLGREMRNSWKGSSTTGTYREQTWRQATQKGQNQACQISTGVKAGEECGWQQERLINSHWNKRKAKEDEAGLS